MAITYTAIDSTGTVHTRTSRGHTKPIYTHAVIQSPGSRKKQYVSFSTSAQGATNLRWKSAAKAEIVSVEARPTRAPYKGKFPNYIRTVTMAGDLVVFETRGGQWFHAEAREVALFHKKSLSDLMDLPLDDLKFPYQRRA